MPVIANINNLHLVHCDHASLQAAYSELLISPKLWPDFREADLMEAFQDYAQRSRRFGKVTPASTSAKTVNTQHSSVLQHDQQH
jgi:Putative undecaprenyl diphosphate synthase